MYQSAKHTWFKHYDFMLSDLLCMELSFVLALCLRFGMDTFGQLMSNTKWSAPYYKIMVIILCLHLALVIFIEPYSDILKRRRAAEFRAVVIYDICIWLGIVVVMFAEQSSDVYSRIAMFTFPMINFVGLFGYRQLYKQRLRKEINRPENQSCMLLVAPQAHVKEIVQAMQESPVQTSRVVGVVLTDTKVQLEVAVSQENKRDASLSLGTPASNEMASALEGGGTPLETRTYIEGIPVVGTMDNMYEYARTNVVDEVLLYMDNESIGQVVEAFMDMGIIVHISIQNLIQIPKATFNTVDGISVVTAYTNMMTAKQMIAKRLIDIIFGLIGSLITVLLMVVIVPAIWIADPGPIFFRQKRVGRNGRTFTIWKFRSMYKDAEARKAELMAQNKMKGHMFKMDDDPRIIGYGKKFSLGRFLRESSLDEFPQFFNILAGSMSLVGTRPPTVKEYEQYELHHKGRLAIKPGLTGMWQVSGRSSITDFEDVVQLDKEYIDNFSLMLDWKIILKTFKVVLKRMGSV